MIDDHHRFIIKWIDFRTRPAQRSTISSHQSKQTAHMCSYRSLMDFIRKKKKMHQRPCFPYGNNDLVKREEKFQLVSMSYLYTLEFNCMNYKEEACLFHNNRQLYFIISFFRFQPTDGTPLFPFDLSTAADRWHQSFVLSVFHLTSFIILKSILFLSIINEMEPTPDGSSWCPRWSIDSLVVLNWLNWPSSKERLSPLLHAPLSSSLDRGL